MSVNSEHPEYTEIKPLWTHVGDAYKGEYYIKQKGETYLSMTTGMKYDVSKGTPSIYGAPIILNHTGDPMSCSSAEVFRTEGHERYETYKDLARYPDLVSTAVRAMVGILAKEKPVVEMPDKMEYLKEKMPNVIRKIIYNQVLYGRCLTLVDINSEGLPEIYVYSPLDVINWDTAFVVLQENACEIEDYAHNEYIEYRICEMVEGAYRVLVGDTRENKEVKVEAMEDLTPSYMSNTFSELPVVFINTNDTDQSVSDIPLLPLANVARGVYNADAQYRFTLGLSAEPTGVATGVGVNDKIDVGAYKVTVMGSPDAKFYYAEAECNGLEQNRLLIESDMNTASAMGVSLMDTSSKESGEALKIRMAAKTASLFSIAKTLETGLTKTLQHVASIMGLNPDDIEVKVSTDFASPAVSPQEIKTLLEAKNLGAVISNESIHALMAQSNTTEMTYDEEVEAIADEPADLLQLFPSEPESEPLPEPDIENVENLEDTKQPKV